jgi:UDP-N-acetylglucosamine--N-acetylmuramyl-(pentapeptide) pyrophosphoryl-undecaprenol N-acetylglucosamine transferase
MRKSIIIAGGGTGGHLFPALAIGDAYKKRFPNSAIHFVGTRFGLEARILPENERPHTLLGIRGFMRGYSITALSRNLLFPFRFCFAYIKSRQLLKRLSPVAVIGTGGYASGLPLLAAIHKGIPTVIHEQNSYPGVTTRWLSSRVNTVCISYEDARRHLKKKVVSSPATPFVRRFLAVIGRKLSGILGCRNGFPLLGFSAEARVL